MRKMWLAAMAATSLAVSCGKDEGIDSNGETDADTDTDTDSDTDSDTDTDTDTDVAPLETVAIGFYFEYGWVQDKGIEYACYPNDKDPKKPYCVWPAKVTLANIDFFSDTTEEAQDADSCEFYADIKVADAFLAAEGYDPSGPGGNGTSKVLWDSWEGTLVFDEKLIPKDEVECYNLDKTYFPSGDPIDVLNGMHIGFGNGPLSAYIEKNLGDTTAKDYMDEVFSGYVAVNHPDGAGGIADFVAYDWNENFLFEWDENHLAVLDGDSNLQFVPTNIPVNLQGIVRSFPFWYEDFPNLDLTLMKATK